MTSTLIDDTEKNHQPLSLALRTHTAQAHEDAEHSSFMSNLLTGKLNAESFIRLQEQSWLFYSALEHAVRACATDSRTGQLLDVRLERRQALETDLDALHGSTDWRDSVQATSATASYVHRLQAIGEAKDVPRVIAHHYVRYLGDLSGGQVIARMVSKEYGVAENALNFYRFEELGKLKPFKDEYRAALDALELTDTERASLLAEASDAFTFNHDVFEALN